ncbi:MAG: AIR synthase-related protein [Planctomycetota bacterium]
MRHARALGLALDGAATARVYLIEAALRDDQIDRLARGLLANPVTESPRRGASDAGNGTQLVEVHPLAGVMDPAAQSVADAARELLELDADADLSVSTGWRYELSGVTREQADAIAARLLANPVVSGAHAEAFWPDALPHGSPAEVRVVHVPVRDLDDAALEALSRDAHLFLDLAEMRAIRDEYRALGREPTEIELETLAQTWSEHCVHKTLKSTIRYETGDPSDPVLRRDRPGHEHHADGSVTIHNLLKSTVAAATHELIAEGVDWTLSVFVDNAGIVAFDDEHAVCIKVETHNHPSAIEPYGGAATGIGGCIRDIIGTGLAARPIANTDVFCVAPFDIAEVPDGCIHPERVLSEVVAGVRDYGNRMGIPTLNGAVWFDERYVGNPLVFAGCVGIMPRALVEGDARTGDLIVALGGRTGRDGIHGATFSSAELTDTHADEFAHAVQIGNPIEEKRVLDAILRARDDRNGPLFTAITDCGAGGFSSAVGEMGEKIGAEVHLDRAPLKYAGLTSTEIWISEAQERMVLAVPEGNLDALRAICDAEHVELAVLGTFGTPGRELILNNRGVEVGRLPMAFVHDGIPTPTREARWTAPAQAAPRAASEPSTTDALLALLATPNIASKHRIIRQYDHEVQGNTLLKPLVGPMGRGPGDAAVIQPVPGSPRGLAIGCGLATGLEGDPYQMALAAIDECVRNLVCVGADPDRIAILDNFCWPSCKKPQNLASLVRAAEGCYDGAKAYRTPFVSGKDSLNNQFTTTDGRTIEIPPTLLITGMAIVPDVERCVTMDAKREGNLIVLVGPHAPGLDGSHYERLFGAPAGAGGSVSTVDLDLGPALARAIAGLISRGLVQSAHDVFDGGALAALAEMCIAGTTERSPIGAELHTDLPDAFRSHAALFAECPSCWLLEIDSSDLDTVRSSVGVGMVTPLASLTGEAALRLRAGDSIDIDRLAQAWLNGVVI